MKRFAFGILGVLTAAGLLIFLLKHDEPKLHTGDRVPDLTLQFRSKTAELSGRPLLIEFWATWCAPCRKSIPRLNRFYREYQSKGLQVVGITEEDTPLVEKFEKVTPILYPVAIKTPKKILSNFGVDGLPQAFLIARDGKLAWTGHPLELTDLEVRQILQ